MKRILLAAALLIFTSAISQAADETCAACDRKVLVVGEFRHSAHNPEAVFADATPRQSQPYREEIYGQNFSVTVPNLPPGKYSIALGFAETWFTNAGERVFDVTCGSQTLVTNLDIFAKVGAAKIYRVTVEVEHQGDALAGPLTISFTGKKQNAKLNTFELREADNKTALVSVAAADLVEPNDPELMKIPDVKGAELWKDPTKSIADRTLDLLDRLTPAEKIALMRNGAPRIERLGIPSYDQWSECLHGVGNAGTATVFPQAIGMAAAWDTALMHDIGDVISVEGRAKHNDYAAKHKGNSARFFGLTFWTPNINIFRDPRWGRGQETYGEDPFLAARLAVPFIHGLQGEDPDHLKAMGCAKHFAVHSGPEADRHHFDVAPGERDLYETYLPQFEVAVREGKVGAVMGAYNRVFNEPACSSEFLLNDTLRKKWGFTGHVV
ncbi:MAG: Periplasmic beta-glucosidase precursor, partial [Verrucomicrobiota bacterium]